MTDISDIRRKRLADICEKRFGGHQSKMAAAIDKSANYLSRALSDGPNRKKIGEKFARDVESKLGLNSGFLDEVIDNQSPGSVKFYNMIMTREAAQFAIEWDKLDEPVRSQMRELVESMVAAQIRAKRQTEAPPPENRVIRQQKRTN